MPLQELFSVVVIEALGSLSIALWIGVLPPLCPELMALLAQAAFAIFAFGHVIVVIEGFDLLAYFALFLHQNGTSSSITGLEGAPDGIGCS